MHRQLTVTNAIRPVAILFILVLAFAGCSSSNSDLTAEVSGKYQTEQGGGAVDINLARESSSVTIDGHTFKGVVEKVDKGTSTVLVRVETEGGSKEVWSIHQVWNDNGSAFKLNLRRNGSTEILIPVGRS